MDGDSNKPEPTASQTHAENPKKMNSLKKFVWAHKRLFVGVIAIVLILTLAVAVTPLGYQLNARLFGKVSSRIVILNAITNEPIVGAKITVGAQQITSDTKGELKLSGNDDALSAEFEVSGERLISKKAVVAHSKTRQASHYVAVYPDINVYFFEKDANGANLVLRKVDGSMKSNVLQFAHADAGQVNTTDWQMGIPAMRANASWDQIAIKVFKLGSKNQKDEFLIQTVDTSNKKATDVPFKDVESAELIGWVSDRFLVVSDSSKIQSYDIQSGAVKTVYESGKDREVLSVYIIQGKLVFGERCVYQPDNLKACDGESGAIKALNPAEGATETLRKLQVGALTNEIYGPNELYFTNYNDADVQYFKYDGRELSETTKENAEGRFFRQMFASPSGQASFWVQQHDGMQYVHIADGTGGNDVKYPIIAGRDVLRWDGNITNYSTVREPFYAAYGWVGEEYVILANKENSSLYIRGVNPNSNTVFVSQYMPSGRGYEDYRAGYPGASSGYAFPF